MWYTPSHKKFSVTARCIGADALSPTARCANDALSLHGRCVDGVLREKNKDSRRFLKENKVVVYPYHLGEVEFRFLTYREDRLDPSS